MSNSFRLVEPPQSATAATPRLAIAFSTAVTKASAAIAERICPSGTKWIWRWVSVFIGAPPAFAIVDGGGHVLMVVRPETPFAAAAEVSVQKARTAAIFRKETIAFENAVNGGRYALLGVDVMTPLMGGVPIVVDGQVVGAIGISGAKSQQQDDAIAHAAAAVVQ